MTTKIREHLIAFNASKGLGISDAELHETIRECGIEVHSELGAKHRWYTEKFVVKMIDGMLIGYDTFYTTGDTGWSDLGLEHDLSKVYEVEMKTKTVEYYEKIAS